VGVDDRELERLIEGTVPEDNEVALLVPWTLLEELPVRLVAGIIPADALGRLVAGIEPEDELEIIRDREFGVDGLELWVDVVLEATASVVELDVAWWVFTGVDGRVLAGVDGRGLIGVDDLAGTGREAGTGCFGAAMMLLLLLGVVGLELTEEMLVLRTDVLLLFDIRLDWTEGRVTELLLAGLVGTAECPFSVWDTESLDALVVEDDLVRVRLGNIFEDGVFWATSRAGTRGVPGGVRSLRSASQNDVT
jgi:hypothetical protein